MVTSLLDGKMPGSFFLRVLFPVIEITNRQIKPKKSVLKMQSKLIEAVFKTLYKQPSLFYFICRVFHHRRGYHLRHRHCFRRRRMMIFHHHLRRQS